MEDLQNLKERNDRLKSLLSQLFDAFSQTIALSWIFTYLLVIFVLWWGFGQTQMVFSIAFTWVFEFGMTRLSRFVEQKQKELENA